MRPLLILALGRSGTTYLMRLLAAHPQIVAHEAYPLEFAPFLCALFPHEDRTRSLKLYPFEGEATLLHEKLDRGERLTVEDARRIYAALARLSGKTARYFLEKCWPQGDTKRIVQADREARFIGLLRDPRDVLLSARAFDRKRGYRGFREADGDTDEQLVEKYRVSFDRLVDRIDATGATVVRYEDLIAGSDAALSGLLASLDLETSPSVLARCRRTAQASEDGRHMTSTSAADSIGRWRTEMPQAVEALCRSRLGHVLDRFGYRHDAGATIGTG